jgi:peptidoglycan/xylan/chitin deacetylase (PgdA/CDA1 family)
MATVGSLPWPLGAWSTAVRPSLTPTLSRTPKPSPTENPLTTGGINLGCPAGSLHPAPWVDWIGPATSHEVALTFDDGPSLSSTGDWTASILTTLEQTHTPATFFVVGASAHTRPNMIAREAADGFTVAIHTWDHLDMTKLTPTARAWELSSTADAIHAALGPHYCLAYWRPPYGDYNTTVVAQARAMGLTTVTWNLDPQDWTGPGVSVIVQRVLSRVQPGSIILLHDGVYGGYNSRQQTAQALPQIIRGLRARGLRPVTLPQLLSGTPP